MENLIGLLTQIKADKYAIDMAYPDFTRLRRNPRLPASVADATSAERAKAVGLHQALSRSVGLSAEADAEDTL